MVLCRFGRWLWFRRRILLVQITVLPIRTRRIVLVLIVRCRGGALVAPVCISGILGCGR